MAFILKYFQKICRFLFSKILITLSLPTWDLVSDAKLWILLLIHTLWFFVYDYYINDQQMKKIRKSKPRKVIQEFLKGLRKGISQIFFVEKCVLVQESLAYSGH